VSLLLLLLRLLTGPAQAQPADPVAENSARPAAVGAPVDASASNDANADLATVEAGPRRIRKLLPAAGNRPIYAGCVNQRLAEAQVHVSLARDEMKRLTTPSTSPADRAHARERLAFLAQRTREVQHAAVSCIDEDDSSISATRYQTQVPPAIQKMRDPTTPPPLAYPCNGSGDCMVIPAP